MVIVTFNTLKSFGFNFANEDRDSIEGIIDLYEKNLLDAALSPQLADVFVTDPSDARFDTIRNGWIDSCDIRQNGLDYAANYWCAFYVIQSGSISIVNGAATTKISENNVRLDESYVNDIFNKSTSSAAHVTNKIEEDRTDYPEYTNGQYLGSREDYNF